MENEKRYVERKQQSKFTLVLPPEFQDKDDLSPEELKIINTVVDHDYWNSNSRCVSVDTFWTAPDGRTKKKERFKAKKELVKFRCSIYEKKLLQVKAKRSGLSLSEYCRKVAAEKDINERLSDEQMEIYRTLVKFHNNFKAIGNMFRKRDPKLSTAVYVLADEIKLHLQQIKK
ncbi:MAG: mobilization protein MbpA [Salinimicrobium sp.]